MVQEPAQEPMAGAVYFHALMDEMPKLMGMSSRTLDRDEVKGSIFYNYMARHSFLVSLLLYLSASFHFAFVS